jgi:hypothetical protein
VCGQPIAVLQLPVAVARTADPRLQLCAAATVIKGAWPPAVQMANTETCTGMYGVVQATQAICILKDTYMNHSCPARHITRKEIQARAVEEQRNFLLITGS